MVHKRNALRKAIAGLKGIDIKGSADLGPSGASTQPTIEPEWNFKEYERAFREAYRSYRVNGRSRMDYSTFFGQIRELT